LQLAGVAKCHTVASDRVIAALTLEKGRSTLWRVGVSRIFLSHSSANDAEAVALRDWLTSEGWDDTFLDTDPERGIAAGQRWERALNQAAYRCEAVLFLVSRAWLESGWCLKEFNLAQRLNKRLFGVLIEDFRVADLPVNLTSTWQLVQLAAGRDHVMLRATMPNTGEEAHVTFSREGLVRLKNGLRRAGLDPRFFAWPPKHDPHRPPYRGLLPLEAEDAGIFFGREAPIIEALDRLRGLRQGTPPRLLVILGASGAGKSSFLRAGLLPRLQRDDRNFLPLPVLRPQRAAISGDTGFLRAMETALKVGGLSHSRAAIRTAIEAGASGIRPLLQQLSDKTLAVQLANEPKRAPPIFVLPIDQGEELFLAEAAEEAERLLALMRDLLADDAPGVLALMTIRSDSYERLQSAKHLDGITQAALSLPPMPGGAYEAVIEGPPARLRDTTRAVAIDPALTQALLADVESGGGRDALPLLAFTLERLFSEYGASGRLTVVDYEALGRIKGSIEVAIERAFNAADLDSAVPKDRLARLALLRRGLIPWLAGIDPDSGAPRRRVARLSEIPSEARPLIQHLVEQRLLVSDVARDTGEATIEPAHEALLRQWGLLQGWLAEDAGYLGILEGVNRACRDWSANANDTGWLIHSASRLTAAERVLRDRPDLAAQLGPNGQAYLAACRKRENEQIREAKRGKRQVLAGLISLVVIVAYMIWTNHSYLKMRIALLEDVWWPSVLTDSAERALKPKQTFKECANCPLMVVVPLGEFMMGASAQDRDAIQDESPQRKVRIARPFAVSVFEVTFDEWDACVSLGGCTYQPSEAGWGRGARPAMNVSWDEVQIYLVWLSKQTGKHYRLLSEAEWEYSARAGNDTIYTWGNEIGTGNANCNGCGSRWDNKQTAPVGSFSANAFGLFDMAGNVSEWVQDCYQANYNGAPIDGSARTSADCVRRVVRGGSYGNLPAGLRSSSRFGANASFRFEGYGFRVARELKQ
jgi:formylglycine-generating enzyme required for sulfatase activity